MLQDWFKEPIKINLDDVNVSPVSPETKALIKKEVIEKVNDEGKRWKDPLFGYQWTDSMTIYEKKVMIKRVTDLVTQQISELGKYHHSDEINNTIPKITLDAIQQVKKMGNKNNNITISPVSPTIKKLIEHEVKTRVAAEYMVQKSAIFGNWWKSYPMTSYQKKLMVAKVTDLVTKEISKHEKNQNSDMIYMHIPVLTKNAIEEVKKVIAKYKFVPNDERNPLDSPYIGNPFGVVASEDDWVAHQQLHKVEQKAATKIEATVIPQAKKEIKAQVNALAVNTNMTQSQQKAVQKDAEEVVKEDVKHAAYVLAQKNQPVITSAKEIKKELPQITVNAIQKVLAPPPNLKEKQIIYRPTFSPKINTTERLGQGQRREFLNTYDKRQHAYTQNHVYQEKTKEPQIYQPTFSPKTNITERLGQKQRRDFVNAYDKREHTHTQKHVYPEKTTKPQIHRTFTFSPNTKERLRQEQKALSELYVKKKQAQTRKQSKQPTAAAKRQATKGNKQKKSSKKK
jgi:hypothetical protein